MAELTMDEKIASVTTMTAPEIAQFFRDNPDVKAEIANREYEAKSKAAHGD